MSSRNFSKSCTPNLGGISDFYTKAEINQLLNAKANLSTVYSRTYLDNRFSEIDSQIDGLFASQITQADLDAALLALKNLIESNVAATYATLANTYTKTEVDSLIDALNLDPNTFLLKTPTSLQPNIIDPGSNNTVSLTVKGSSTNPTITEWVNSLGNTVAYIRNDGNATFENKVTIGRLVSAGAVGLDVQNRRITGVADPTANSDAVPYSFLQSYVDGITGGSGQTISVLANNGLALNIDVLSTEYNTLVPDNVYSVSVGGAPATLASTWKTRNIVEVLDAILFPTVPASVGSGKSVNLTVSGVSGTLETGRTVSRVLTATFGAGQIINGDGSNGPVLVGAATSYSFTGTGISLTNQPGSTLSVTNVVVNGTNNWAVTVSHAGGTGAYYDSKLVQATNLDSLRLAGTVTDSTSSPSITGVYPYFWGVSDTGLSPAQIAGLVVSGGAQSNKVVEASTGTISITFDASAKYIWFAHPSVSPTKTRWYSTTINNGDIGSPTGLFGASATELFDSFEGYWSGVNYRVYVSNYATTTSGVMELRNN